MFHKYYLLMLMIPSAVGGCKEKRGEGVILQVSIRRDCLVEKKTAHLPDWAGTLLRPAVELLQNHRKLRAVLHLDEIALG